MSPLRKGSSSKIKSQNISELMHAYRRSGKIGNVKPHNEQHAREIAAAIAYEKAKKGKTNPIFQGKSDYPIGITPGGAGQLPPFLRKK